MSFNAILDRLVAAFEAHTQDARVILLHAKGRYRTALVSHLLSDGRFKTFYYALGPDDTDVKTFLSGFIHDISEQNPRFGTNVNQVGLQDPANLPRLMEAFVSDLEVLSETPYLLILDEFDRPDIVDDLQAFIEQLVESLPEHCRLVLSGRNLPRLPWLSLIAQKKAVILRDDELVAENFYENQNRVDPRVEISALGPGNVILDGELVETWEGHLPRLLFFFALERPFVTRSEICQSFWPELQNEQAVNVFHVTKRRLHKALDALGMDILIHENGYYRVNPALSIYYDVVDYVAALVQGRNGETPQARLQAYERAIKMHERHFLQGHNEAWIQRRRAEYRAGYIEALCGMAEVRLGEDRPEHALALLQKAATEDPSRQDLHRRIMKLYADLGRRSEAASHFSRLQAYLNDHDLELEAETKKVYKEVMS